MNRRLFLGSALGASAQALFPPKLFAQASPAPATDGLTLLSPDSAAFVKTREIFNSHITLQPAIIAQCQTEESVAAAVRYAAQRDLPIAIKSGGHSFEGFCLNEGGMVIDLSGMKHRAFDAKSGIFTAGSGNVLKDVNGYLLPKGRLLPAGSCAGTGLAGLTLGGGYGFFAREYGLTCDHLTSVRIVDGSGQLRDSHDEPELLWACRGGGNGHFGVVTEFQFRTHDLPKEFASCRLRAKDLTADRVCEKLEKWFASAAALPRTAFSSFVLNGRSAMILVTTHGSVQDKALVSAVKEMASFMDTSEPFNRRSVAKALPSYYGHQAPLHFKNGSAGYYKGYDALRSVMSEIAETVINSPRLTILQINTLGGVIAEGEASAYPHREYGFLGEWQSYWDKPIQAPERIAAVEKIRDLIVAAGIDRHYANYPNLGFTNWQTAYYGTENYRRLQAVKASFDPENRIRHPQSVRKNEGI